MDLNDNISQFMASQRRLLISAFGIHIGGGLVLFRSLLLASRDITRKVALDARMPADAFVQAAEGGVQLAHVPKSFLARLRSVLQIGREASHGDIFLCFNSLPPLARSRAKVIVYVQAPHFFGAHAGIRYARTVALRLLVERLWFWYGSRYVDEFWVQTPTMASLLTAKHPAVTVKVLPLIDEKLADLLQTQRLNTACSGSDKDYSRYDFFYPADAVGHKNHIQLLRAWHILDRSGHHPRLTLTLSQDEFYAVHRLAGIRVGELTQIINIGRQARLAVLDRLEKSSALIFPSPAETFGLPMLEATSLGVPIIASERDFVRDVCTPQESFDPSSARSIADAVVRFVEGKSAKPLQTYSPGEFVTLLNATGHE
jgi:glycosyltransferase involved in cell wall biosynthesis